MTRSPLFYPLKRSDAEAGGGAADLQTDIMRFMAILALCLVAIFALVQSIPLAPPEPETQRIAQPVRPASESPPQAEPQAATEPAPTESPPTESSPEAVVLTRPTWVSTFVPTERQAARPDVDPEAPAAPERQGFTLRFESDRALTRLVAAGQVGFYAIGPGRAQRMSVSDSRISFWDASAPDAFHEMETATVPRAVVDALSRTGTDTVEVDWGVTLPGRLRSQLDSLMRESAGGALVIGTDGNLRLERS